MTRTKWLAVLSGLLAACAGGSLLGDPYLQAQSACVDAATSRAEAEACACRVRATYGRDCDAGALEAGR